MRGAKPLISLFMKTQEDPMPDSTASAFPQGAFMREASFLKMA
jgi:hypothetical protein